MVELGADIVGVGEVESGGVERDDAGRGDAKDPTIPSLHECLTTMYQARYLGSSATAVGAEAIAADDVTAGEVHGG
jgi:hypothetical protein